MKSSKSAFKAMYSIDQSTKSKVEQEIPTLSLTSTFNQLLKRIHRKYDDCSSAVNLKYTESIVKGADKSYNIKFKDYRDYDQRKENLEGMYEGEEIEGKFQEVVGYYVFYEDIPRLFMLELSHVVSKRIEQQRVLRYKALRSTLGITGEDLKQSVKQIGDLSESKCLPTGIMEDQTENSIRSIVKKLSILISEQHQRQQKYALTEGCLTLMRTNKKKMNPHKLNTMECAKSKSKQKLIQKVSKAYKQNRKIEVGSQKIPVKKSRPFSGSKEIKKTTRAASSKRKESNKSVQDLIKKHIRHNTKSPEPFQKTLKKKHIRMFSSQPDEMCSIGKSSHKIFGKSSYEQICLQGSSKCKQKPTTFIKKKTRYQG